VESREKIPREGAVADIERHGAIAWWRGATMVYVIYFALFAAAWAAGGIAGWLSGDPSRAHALLITLASIALPVAWMGAAHLWKVVFWERVPVTGPSGIQYMTRSGLAWEYRRKQKLHSAQA
jgi:hypothetical protein